MRWTIAVALGVLVPRAAAGVVFEVTLAPGLVEGAVDGRLIVFAIRGDAPLPASTEPIDGPFWDSPQPMWGIDVRGLAPGGTVRVDDGATSFGFRPSALPAGEYRFQARLDRHRADSDWRREPGNLYSDVVVARISGPPNGGEAAAVRIELTRRIEAVPPGLPPGFEEVRVRSALLSEFAGSPVDLIASVTPPSSVEPGRRYAAVYFIPGFGGTHAGTTEAQMIQAVRSAAWRALGETVFLITLNPESPNGHALFADSACNGPWGAALTTELIPALEARFPLDPRPAARLLRGHSSGGWSCVWLAIMYPEVFGAAWASAPDPIDFRAFQQGDLLTPGNMFGTIADRPEVTPLEPLPGDVASYRRAGRERMSVAQENAMEEVLGPGNTSGGQWDSWQAVFGPRAPGSPELGVAAPAGLFDPRTGAINPDIAESYRPYDIGRLLRDDPGRFGPIFKQRIRILCGSQDSFYLEKAVGLVKDEVDKLSFFVLPEGDHGYITIVPGRDHGSVLRTPEAAAIYPQMLEHLRRNGLAVER